MNEDSSITLTPTRASRTLVFAFFILPVLAVYPIGFSGLTSAILSGILIAVFPIGVCLLLPGFNSLKLDGSFLEVRIGPFPPRRIPIGDLEEASSWSFFYTPFHARRPVLIWRDESGAIRKKPLFHVFGSGLGQTREVLSGRSGTEDPSGSISKGCENER